MVVKRVSATEFARNLSSMLNEVRYRSVSLEVWRSKEAIARVTPPARGAGYPVDRLNDLFAALPRLSARDTDDFLRVLDDLDRTVGEAGSDAWAS